MSVCQQRVNASLQFRYFRQPTHLGRHETYDFSQHFMDMIGIFTTLQVHAFGQENYQPQIADCLL